MNVLLFIISFLWSLPIGLFECQDTFKFVFCWDNHAKLSDEGMAGPKTLRLDIQSTAVLLAALVLSVSRTPYDAHSS